MATAGPSHARGQSTGPMLYVTWITLMTVAIAFFSSDPVTDKYLRPLFFAALLSFFVVLGRREPTLRTLAYRLMEMGFLLLSLGSLLAAFLRQGALSFLSPTLSHNLAFGLDRGVGFLLGFSLLSYGIVLWVPELLESQRVLRENLQRKREEAIEQELALEKAKEVIVRQEALVSVGELSAGVAHELRNPLAIVKSALQRLRSSDLDEEERQRCLEIMERAVTKSNRRITGLLDLGRATDFAPRWCNAREFLKSCAELTLASARVAEVEVVSRDVDPAAEFFGDSDLLLQVVVNLVRNAIQAVPHEGPIEIGFEQLEHRACRFTVEDHGRGIDDEHIANLFTPFFTTKDDGTGLGLTVSANLIEKHEGRLWLERREERGTRALIELPGPDGRLTPPLEELAHA